MNESKIQWCDDTENPVAGCDGCELWPNIAQILARLTSLILRFSSCKTQEVRDILKPIVNEFETASELWHDREFLLDDLREEFPEVPDSEWEDAIKRLFKCYAGHINLDYGGRSEHDPFAVDRGYGPIFELPTKFPGRMAKTARLPDLRGIDRPDKPWSNGLPRMIFVSDMGDALSEAIDFDYLKTEIVDVVSSPDGCRHIWQWLTKRPDRMAEFAAWLLDTHGIDWPENLVAMTTVTNRATRSRIDDLRQVPARLRGLSVEPLVESVGLDISGIDWLIAGGESGDYAREFDIEWARSLKDQCRRSNVAFFLKQLGANVVGDGFPIELIDSHGGDWDEWSEDLRVREFPAGFADSHSDQKTS